VADRFSSTLDKRRQSTNFNDFPIHLVIIDVFDFKFDAKKLLRLDAKQIYMKFNNVTTSENSPFGAM
jgi:hypothetical protein